MEFRTLSKHHAGYKVSECGTVVISPRTNEPITIQDNMVKGKISGYKYVTLLFSLQDGFMHYTIKRCTVHSLVCELWHGEKPEDKPWVNHKDGVKGNNHYTNLEWSSISENIKHSYDVLGRKPARNMLGKKHKVSSKEKQSFAKLGVKHPKFKGYYRHFDKEYITLVSAGKSTGISGTEVLRRVRANRDGWSFVPKEEPVIN